MEDFREALQEGDLKQARDMLNNAQVRVNGKDEYGMTPLMYASEVGDRDLVLALINMGADVNAREIEGRTPLMFASHVGHVKVVMLLIMKGADVNAAEREKHYTALMLAAMEGHALVVRALLMAGAFKTKKDTDEKTALEHAREADKNEIVAMLSVTAAAGGRRGRSRRGRRNRRRTHRR
jgi:ankyrin repeat protein